MKKRRDFIKALSIGGAAIMFPLNIKANILEDNKVSEEPKLKFGICTDVHKDIMHDADQRLQAFIDDATENSFDFIIQLGDFCRPYDYNKSFMDVWNSFPGKRYHVLGNHDMDGGFSRKQVLKYWDVDDKYYSFDTKGHHFIVLDGNDKDTSDYKPTGYARYIGEKQLNWLETDLAETDLPTIIFCHQGLDNDLGGIFNSTQTRLILEEANKKANFNKVEVVFSGHHHQDYQNNINGIHYIQINSMSNFWLGSDYKQKRRYGRKIDKSHPWIKYTAPYKDPIWANVEIYDDNTFKLNGKKTEFVGPSPKDLKVDMTEFVYPIVPYVSDKEIKL